MTAKFLRQSALWLLLIAALVAPASAQNAVPAAAPTTAVVANAAEVTVDSINVATRDKIGAIRTELEATRASIERNTENDGRLAELRVDLERIDASIDSVNDAIATRLGQIQARLGDLGEAPAADQPAEAPAVTEERNRLLTERAELNVISSDAGNLAASITSSANSVSNLRRALFTNTLFRHTELSGDLFTDAGNALVTEFRNLSATFGSWLGFVWKFKQYQLLGAIALSIIAALLILAGSYRLFGRYLERGRSDSPSYIRRLSLAFWSTVVGASTLAAFLLSTFFLLDGFNVLRPDVSAVIATFFAVIWIVYFVWQLAHSVLAPSSPEWRLVAITDNGARLLHLAVLAMALVNSLDYLSGTLSEVLGSPLVVTVAKSLVASVVIGLIIIAISFIRPRLPEGEASDAPGQPWPKPLAVLLRVLGVLLILCALVGYVGLSRFASTQIVLTGAVAVLIYIGLLSGKEISRQGSFKDTAAGRYLGERLRFGDVALDQTGLAAGLGIYALALVFGVPVVLLTWGFQLADIESWVVGFFTEIRIGNISISLVAILGGILLFAAGFVITRWVQKWIDGNIMARSQVDLGVRNSVRTGIGYLGVGIAALAGVSAAGIDLSSFALVASALSIGIGFGLQNIVSNFVSGLILLVERPFKVGDHVVSGSTEGIVKRISVRATEIETFRKQSIIVPNSELINSPVGNWTHRNRIARSEIAVSVSYDADPRKVIATLLELVQAIPQVLRNPAPHVEFLRFGASSLDFELRYHLVDMGESMTVKNSLMAQILDRFREEGIEMPMPQQEIVFHQGDPIAHGSEPAATSG